MEKYSIEWLKLFIDFLDGDSFKHMRRAKVDGVLDPRDKLEAVWWELLSLAGKCNHGGALWNEEIAYKTNEEIAIATDRTESEIDMCMAFYVKQGMVTITPNGPIINNFDKYQSIDKLVQIREANRIRQAKHRDAVKKLTMSRDSNVTSQESSQETEDVDVISVESLEVLPSFTKLNPNRGFGPYIAYLYDHSYLTDFDLTDNEIALAYKDFLSEMDEKYGNRNLHLTLKYFVSEYCRAIWKEGRVVGWELREEPQSKLGLLKKSVLENCEKFSGKSEDERPFDGIDAQSDQKEWDELISKFSSEPKGGD